MCESRCARDVSEAGLIDEACYMHAPRTCHAHTYAHAHAHAHARAHAHAHATCTCITCTCHAHIARLRDVTVDDGALLPQRTVEVRLLLHVPAHRVPRSARTHAVEVGDECGEEGVKLARVRAGVRIRVRVRVGVRVRVRVGVRVGVGIGAGGLSPSMRTRCCSSRSCARSNVSIARTHSPASFFIRQVCTVSHTERVQPST